MLLLASVTDHLVTFATHVIRDLGVVGVFLLMAADATAIPFPSEATLLFAGFNVYDGHSTLLAVCVAGILGDVFGASIAYAIGYFGREELLERHGPKIHLTPKRLAMGDRFYTRHGSAAVFFGRLIPVLRAFSSFPAGIARMPYPRFVLLTAAGAAPWVIGFAFLGREVGSNWESWRKHLAFLDYIALAAIVIGIGYLVVRRLRAPSEPAPDAP
jgi:membrane protein DedA with SNARE-associated domain